VCAPRRTYWLRALVTLNERLSRYELMEYRRGQRAGLTHTGDGHLLLEGEWYGHGDKRTMMWGRDEMVVIRKRQEARGSIRLRLMY